MTTHQVDQLTEKPSSPSSNHLAVVGRWLMLIALLLAAGGASFAPWVDRPAAALKLTAPDLAEFVKFLPEVRNGSLSVQRLLFLLPLFVTSFTLPLVVASSRLAYPRWARWPILVTVVPLSLTLLPPVWSPAVLMSAEFRLQTIGCIFCLVLVAASRWLRWVPVRILMAILVPLSLAAPAVAFWQFYVVRAPVSQAYAGPIFPGWGTWATIIGFAMTITGGLLIIRDR